jgi:ABC-type transport system involved in cytochrome bd biosynthesis fused ATPase/permease subunit
LLDEPTAHLDATTEARVIASLEQAVQGRTVILVTHRPAALSLVDRVVSLDAMAASR